MLGVKIQTIDTSLENKIAALLPFEIDQLDFYFVIIVAVMEVHDVWSTHGLEEGRPCAANLELQISYRSAAPPEKSSKVIPIQYTYKI